MSETIGSLSISEASRRCGVEPKFLAQLCHLGVGPRASRTPDGTWQIDAEAFDGWRAAYVARCSLGPEVRQEC